MSESGKAAVSALGAELIKTVGNEVGAELGVVLGKAVGETLHTAREET